VLLAARLIAIRLARLLVDEFQELQKLLRYSPTMARTFSLNRGSLESLRVSLCCGCRGKARQMRCTALSDKPVAAVRLCGLIGRPVRIASLLFDILPARRTSRLFIQ
jgi:hypothetical protein